MINFPNPLDKPPHLVYNCSKNCYIHPPAPPPHLTNIINFLFVSFVVKILSSLNHPKKTDLNRFFLNFFFKNPPMQCLARPLANPNPKSTIINQKSSISHGIIPL
jgi:hypothetical protein